MIWIFLAVYIFSAMVVGVVHWAEYQENIKYYNINLKKVISLYVMPFVPAFNTLLAFNVVIDYMM